MIEYLAGVLDVYGSMCMRRSDEHQYPRIRVFGKPELLNLLAEEFGGEVKKYCNTYQWEVTRVRAREAVRRVEPYLVVRREIAEKFLNWQPSCPEEGKLGRPQKERREPQERGTQRWAERRAKLFPDWFPAHLSD